MSKTTLIELLLLYLQRFPRYTSFTELTRIVLNFCTGEEPKFPLSLQGLSRKPLEIEKKQKQFCNLQLNSNLKSLLTSLLIKLSKFIKMPIEVPIIGFRKCQDFS